MFIFFRKKTAIMPKELIPEQLKVKTDLKKNKEKLKSNRESIEILTKKIGDITRLTVVQKECKVEELR